MRIRAWISDVCSSDLVLPLAALLRRHLGGHGAVLVEIDGIVGHHLMLSPRRAPAGIIAAQGNRWPARSGRDTRMADPLRLMQAHAQQATGIPTLDQEIGRAHV